MTANKRIFLNIVATYGRSLYGLALGLFSVRWALSALGHVDYGLYGLVGGLVAFVAFFNNQLSGSVSRFYAYTVGKASVAENKQEGLEECRRWFSIAVLIHTLWPTFLIAVGYPMGIWAVRQFLEIPINRVDACVWVWRYACISCFIAMVNVPFNAMYIAKQYIAELTIYAFATSTLNAIFLYYIVTHKGDWLVPYSAWMCCMATIPQILICIRAIVIFPECRFNLRYSIDKGRMKELFGFVGANLVGSISQLCYNQGVNILVNKYLGAAKNATMTIASNVNGQASMLSSAMLGAFSPAITNAAGAGDLERVKSLAFKVCSYGTLCVMLFSVPLILEIDMVLTLWLKNPPAGVAILCVIYLLINLIDKMTDGHWIAILASGRVARFRCTESLTYWGAVLFVWLAVAKGYGLIGVAIALLFGRLCSAFVKLCFGRREVSMSIRGWFRNVFMPLVIIALFTFTAGAFPRCAMEPSFFRIVVTIFCCGLVFLPLSWCLALSGSDKKIVLNKVRDLCGRRTSQKVDE